MSFNHSIFSKAINVTVNKKRKITNPKI